MKYFIRILSVFIPTALAIYLLLLMFWGTCFPNMLKPNLNYLKGGNGFMHTRLMDAKAKSNVDMLVFGSSHAYRGFDPRIFAQNNIELFNLGSSMQTPIQTQMLIQRYLPIIKPKIIIFEVYPYPFCSDGIESSVNIIANDKNDYKTFKMAFKINNIKTYNTLIYGCIHDIFYKNSNFIEPNKFENDTYIKGGFVEKELNYYQPKPLPEITWSYNENQFKAFEETIALLKKLHIDFVMIYAPITKNLYRAVSNQITFHKRMETYGRYYNFNEIIQLNDSLHFYDANHLNEIGVKLFNEKFIEVCIKDKIYQ